MRLDKTLNDPARFGLLTGKLCLSMELMPQCDQLRQIGGTVHGPSVRRLNKEDDSLSLFAIYPRVVLCYTRLKRLNRRE